MAAPRSLMLSARVSVRMLDAAFSNLHARPHDCFIHRISSAYQSRPYGTATPPSTALCSSRERPLAVGSNGICSHVWLAHRASMLCHAAPILQIQRRSSSSTIVTESGPASPETVRYTVGLFHTIHSPKWENLTLSALRVDKYGSFVIADQILLEKPCLRMMTRHWLSHRERGASSAKLDACYLLATSRCWP
ncbi:hypothetical protein U9M48_012518 [Paspalum notatum var. saurae]|uniref:Uncharacterized protein n=1 Tax=Paspalum notatum var. saurae TaxID=547442 RepID=A0AAQ3WIT1_PASNO